MSSEVIAILGIAFVAFIFVVSMVSGTNPKPKVEEVKATNNVEEFTVRFRPNLYSTYNPDWVVMKTTESQLKNPLYNFDKIIRGNHLDRDPPEETIDVKQEELNTYYITISHVDGSSTNFEFKESIESKKDYKSYNNSYYTIFYKKSIDVLHQELKGFYQKFCKITKKDGTEVEIICAHVTKITTQKTKDTPEVAESYVKVKKRVALKKDIPENMWIKK